jgi:hypothetical protein
MATDMDIDMDLDVGLVDEDMAVPEIEITPEVGANVSFLHRCIVPHAQSKLIFSQ